MSDNPTIWMNVTTSANWQRPPVGIVRVERSLCDELAKLYGSRFKQCVWQGERFVEWRPRLGGAVSAEPICQDEPSQSSIKPMLPPIYPILPRKQALLAIGQGILSLMPGRLRPYFNRFLYRIRPRVGRILASERTRRLVARLRGRASTHAGITPVRRPNVSEAPDLGALLFSPGDILISMGLDWDNSFSNQFYSLRKRTGVKVVTCCYDLIPVLYPQYCVSDVARKFVSYFLDLAEGSDLILCISRQSEKDLNDMLYRTGGARPPTQVFPLGDNVPLAMSEEISPAVKAICQEPFILFVSTIERRKNHEVLYRAYHLLCSQGKRADLPKLVFVGMQGWGITELMLDIELDPLTRGLIVQLNHVSDTELRVLYEAARFCVFPSLYEGWGLPVGEALSLGKAVISSDRGSLPEVGGDMVRYVDPWSPQGWADEIYRMATDDIWRLRWEEKSKNQYKPRTWSGAAISVINAINLIGDEK